MHYLIFSLFIISSLLVDVNVYRPYYTPKIYFLIVSVSLMLLYFFIHRLFILKKEKVKFSNIEILLVILFTWRFITNPVIINNEIYFLWSVTLFMLTFLVRQFSSLEIKKFYVVFFKGLWLFGLIQALIGFYQFFSFSNDGLETIKTPMIGSIGSPNGYGSILAVSFMAVLIEYNKSTNLILRFSHVLSLLIIIGALFLNGSRGSVLALLSALIIFFFFYFKHNKFKSIKKRFNKKWIRYSFLLIIFIFLLIIVFKLYYLDKESSYGRLMIYKISLPMFLENPVSGIGYGNYALKYLHYQSNFFSNSSNQYLFYKAVNLKQAHNEYLEIFCETGIIGGFIFFFLIFLVLFSFYKEINLNKNGKRFYNINGIFSILIIILVHSLVDDPLHYIPTSVLFFMILGLSKFNTKTYCIAITSKLLKWCILFLLLFYSFITAYRLLDQYQGYKSWAAGQIHVRNKHISWALPHLRHALEKLPENGELKFHLGSALAFSGQYSKGLYFLKESLKSYNDRNIYLSMSYTYLKLNDLKEAEKSAKTALRMFPDHLSPHLLLGEIYFKMNDIKRSKSSLKKCIMLETKIKSPDAMQIRKDAQNLWVAFFGK